VVLVLSRSTVQDAKDEGGDECDASEGTTDGCSDLDPWWVEGNGRIRLAVWKCRTLIRRTWKKSALLTRVEQRRLSLVRLSRDVTLETKRSVRVGPRSNLKNG
jgi:hypothetical protein